MESIINLIWEAEDDNEKTITPLGMQRSCIAPSCSPGPGPSGLYASSKFCW